MTTYHKKKTKIDIGYCRKRQDTIKKQMRKKAEVLINVCCFHTRS